MDGALLNVKEAATRLGVTAPTLYDWLGQSDHGLLRIRGAAVTIDYLQSGPRGQGRIKIEEREIVRLKELMRVRPQLQITRREIAKTATFPGINVRLGRPDLRG